MTDNPIVPDDGNKEDSVLPSAQGNNKTSTLLGSTNATTVVTPAPNSPLQIDGPLRAGEASALILSTGATETPQSEQDGTLSAPLQQFTLFS
jgi:hypothetical protein